MFWGCKAMYLAYFVALPAVWSQHSLGALAALWLISEVVAGWMFAFLFQVSRLPTILLFCSSQSLIGCLMHAALSCVQHADKAAMRLHGINAFCKPNYACWSCPYFCSSA